MRAVTVIAMAALVGCALKTPPTHTESVEQALPAGTQIPAAWKAGATGDAVKDDWLKSFNDPVL